MKRLLQILLISSFAFGPGFAFAADEASSPDRSVANSGKAIKSNKKKSRSSKLDQQIIAESRAEGGSFSSQEALDELRESLGEK